jgi:DNA modification methylase
MNVPHRLVFALSDAGWYHRQTIIWAKATSGEIREGTCMPESVNDRLNQSFEYIFLLTKKDKYYFDSYAIKEPLSSSTNKESTGMANMRSVWRINLQQGSSGQHIAGYPEKIPYYCIKAGSSEKGCCKDCGKPYERILEKLGKINHSWAPGTRDYHKLEKSKGRHGSTSAFLTDESVNYVHSGWKKTCNCESDEISPSLILDPFMGSGTTAVVALKEDRDLLGIELNPEYKEFAENRIKPYFFKSKDLF